MTNENPKVRPTRADHAQEISRIRAPPEAVEPSVVAPEAPALRSHLHRIVAHPRRPNHRRSEITRRHACERMEIPADSKTCWVLLGKAYQERTLQALQLFGIVDPKLWKSTSFQNKFFLNGCLGFWNISLGKCGLWKSFELCCMSKIRETCICVFANIWILIPHVCCLNPHVLCLWATSTGLVHQLNPFLATFPMQCFMADVSMLATILKPPNTPVFAT